MASTIGIAMASLVLATSVRFRPRPHRTDSILGASARRPPLRSVAAAAVRLRQSDRRRPDPLSVAAWCDELARRVRSGATLRDALATVVPTDRTTGVATAPIRLGLERGRSTVEAIDDCVDDGAHLHLALGVIRTVVRVGGASPLAIDRTAATLRQRAADRDERRVHAAQARLSAHVLTALPLLMLAALLATDPDVRSTIGSPLGSACVVAGLLANIAGWLWMQRLVSADT